MTNNRARGRVLVKPTSSAGELLPADQLVTVVAYPAELVHAAVEPWRPDRLGLAYTPVNEQLLLDDTPRRVFAPAGIPPVHHASSDAWWSLDLDAQLEAEPLPNSVLSVAVSCEGGAERRLAAAARHGVVARDHRPLSFLSPAR